MCSWMAPLLAHPSLQRPQGRVAVHQTPPAENQDLQFKRQGLGADRSKIIPKKNKLAFGAKNRLPLPAQQFTPKSVNDQVTFELPPDAEGHRGRAGR